MAKITIDDRDLITVTVEEGDDIVIPDRISYNKKDKNGDVVENEEGKVIKEERDIFYQKVLMCRGRERIEFKLSLKEGQPAYPMGRYLIHPSFLKVNDRGNLNTAASWDIFIVPMEYK